MIALTALIALAVSAPVEAAKQRNGQIAFTTVRGNGSFAAFATRIVTMRPDGSARRVLPCARRSGGDCFDVEPDYSNDGRRLITISSNGESFSDLVFRTSGGRVLRRAACDCFNAVWSPGNRYIAMGSFEVVLLDLRTSRERRLRMGKPEYVAWSRQGTLVAEPDGFDSPFIVREPNGVRRRVRVRGEKPEWAPDGRRFAYSCTAGACVVGKDGRNKRVLPRGRLCEDRGGLAWSPDGRKIACFSSALDSSKNDRHRGVIVIDLRSRRVRSIAPNVFEAGSIDWAPRVPR